MGGDEIPADMYGAYLRNGPNPQFKPGNRYHPFDGDGLVNGVYFADGKASYRNSQVDTACLRKEQQAGETIWPGVMGPFDFSLPDFPIKDTANTDIIWHNGKLISLWYNSGIPYTLDPITLENTGPLEFGSKLTRKMSAHSRVDWNTGEMFFFDYGDEPPYMVYGVLGPDGTEYGIRILAHDHANEQPFTRSQSGIPIPADVQTVTIQGRDLANGWGGLTFELTLPGVDG